jgi:FkbM family methyltransferase
VTTHNNSANRPIREPLSARRRAADALISLLISAARLPGRRFYRLFLEEIERVNDLGDVAVPIAKRDLHFVCPNELTQWRVRTLFEKEPATIAWIDSFEPGAVLWDIGANIGIYSLYAAFARNARVLAFEPAPANYALLAKNIEINRLGDRVSAFPLALSETRRIGTLSVDATIAGSSSSRFGGTDPASSVELGCLGYSIDAFVADFDPPFPEHIKIDVDGIEEAIVQGGRSAFADPRLKSLSIEFDDREPGKLEFVRSVLRSAGFAEAGSFRSPLFPTSPAQNHHFVRLNV